MTTDETLQKLSLLLRRLVAIMRLDPKCQWLPKVESDLAECLRLGGGAYSAADLINLSASITYVFQGMGSFNDYAPALYDPLTGRFAVIPGAEDFAAVSKEVFDLAIRLKQ